MPLTPETQLIISRFPCGLFRHKGEIREAVASILLAEPDDAVVLTCDDEAIRAAAAESFLDRVDWAEALYWLGDAA